MAQQIEWPGSGSNPTGLTNFGYYDEDLQFQNDAPRVANFCAKSLGYPVMTVEMLDHQFYACFEEAIMEYESQVNTFRMRDNMLSLQGSSTTEQLTHTEIVPNFSRIIKISDMYGTEAEVGGQIDLKKGYITTEFNKQLYDLDSLWTEVSESGHEIEIRRVFHQEPPAVSQVFDPTVGTGINQVLGEFGWTGMAPGITFLMMPVYENLLRMQAIELNNQVRKSGYSFELINNKLRIFPIPSEPTRIYFDYYVKEDKNKAVGKTDVVTDMSNANFGHMEYSKINAPGKQWIRKYTLALSKIMLGNIRSKYQNIPIPGSELMMNGDALKSDGSNEKEQLITQLREDLEATTTTNLMNQQREQLESMHQVLSNVPLPFYVGSIILCMLLPFWNFIQ
jgi:hypothetical protein